VPDIDDLSSTDPLYLDALRDLLVELTPRQRTAVGLIAAGSTHAAAAEAAGVSRETASRWVGHHPGVRAALALYRAAAAADLASRALRIRSLALDVVERNLDDADLNAALGVLRVVAPPMTPQSVDADSLLIADLQRMAAAVPDPPLPSGTDSLLAALLDPDIRADNAKRANRIAIEKLAAAAGLFDDRRGDDGGIEDLTE
jgi:hypothetical protein